MTDETLGTILTEAQIIDVQKIIQKPQELSLTDDGQIEASTAPALIKAVSAYRKMGIVPKQFETDAQAAGAILYAKQLGLNPLQAWGEIACVHGKFTVYGSLFRAIARRASNFGQDEVFFLDEKQERICADKKNLTAPVWACVVRTKTKDSEIWNEHFFSVDEAKTAGIMRPGSAWTKYLKDMLLAKAFARAYRSAYPDALNGVLCYEDIRTDWGEEKDITPKVDLNNL
jgi:hypothetical protein